MLKVLQQVLVETQVQVTLELETRVQVLLGQVLIRVLVQQVLVEIQVQVLLGQVLQEITETLTLVVDQVAEVQL